MDPYTIPNDNAPVMQCTACHTKKMGFIVDKEADDEGV